VRCGGSGAGFKLRPLGYEANGTRPTPLIGSYGVQPSQGRSSMASHFVQLVWPQPTASLLPFLLRSPEDGRGQQCSPSVGRSAEGHSEHRTEPLVVLVAVGTAVAGPWPSGACCGLIERWSGASTSGSSAGGAGHPRSIGKTLIGSPRFSLFPNAPRPTDGRAINLGGAVATWRCKDH
jgi:hypothetical protein